VRPTARYVGPAAREPQQVEGWHHVTNKV
jgi:hypothetical protein